MSRPIPQSRFGDKYSDNYDKIFGKKEPTYPRAEFFSFATLEEGHAHWEKLTGKKHIEDTDGYDNP